MTTSRDDGGFTLIEVLVAVTLLGIGVTVILSGIMTSILTSDIHRKQATGETVLRGYAEAAKKEAASSYSSCATTYTVPFTPAEGYTATLEGVDYWTGSGWAAQPASTCATDDTTQRLRLKAEAADDRSVETVEVVVRKP